MQAYQENISAKVSGVLSPIIGVSVTVTDTSTGLPATLYSDNGVTQIAQPLITDETGYFGFYAANGGYRIIFSSPQIKSGERDIELYDPDDDAPLTQAQAASPTGASGIGYNQRTVANKLDDIVSVKDFGAKGDGATDDTAAIQAAAAATAASGAELYFPNGAYCLTQSIVVVMSMGVKMEPGAWLKPTANVVVLKGEAGSRIVANVDTSANASWDSVALDYEAVSQIGADSARSFQLNTQTTFDVKLKGRKTGTGNGTAIKLHADVASNGGVEGVTGRFYADGFDTCVWLVNNIADNTRWINGNIISGFCNFPVRALRMDDASTFGGGMSGNTIQMHCETRPAATTTALFELAGQNNSFEIMPWDFDGGVGGAVPAITFKSSFSACRLQTYCDPSRINFTNLGNTNTYTNLYGGANGLHASQLSANPGSALLLQSDAISSNLNLSVPNSSGSITWTMNGVQRLSLTNSGNMFWRGAAASGGVTLRNFGTTGTIDFPTVATSDTLAALAAVQTFTNKTLTQPKVTTQVVSALGSATAGLKSIVTDGSVTAAGNFGAVVAGGGANTVPVYADGTNWRIG